MSASWELIAATAFGLEAVVARELKALGCDARGTDTGHVLFHADAAVICRANVRLRTADRVYVRLGTFEAADFGVLFDGVYSLPWEAWIPADGAFPVRGRSIRSQLSSVPACQRIVKKAVAEKLAAAHRVEDLPESGPACGIELVLRNDQATLLLDTTGPSLHKRGYRKLTGKAQLKQTLAAALVQLSFWRPERPLIDPFCGTGAIPIEAALIGRNIAPGVNREFAAEGWPAIPQSAWDEARTEARDLELPSIPARLIGTDIDEEALSLARYHARQAGVADDVHFQQRPFAELASRSDYGCVITNPPYGARLHDRDLDALYRSFPLVLRKLPTWSFYILTAYPNFEQIAGRTADRRRKLYNGRIECTYYQFHGPDPRARQKRSDASTAATTMLAADDGESGNVERPKVDPPRPAFGGLTDKAFEQAELFRNRLVKRARHLRRWPTKRGITCYRLYDRDIPEIPLVVDRYEACLHIAEYERPHDRTPAEHADWLDLMTKTAAEALDVDRREVYLKHRARQRGDEQYQPVSRDSRIIEAREGDLRFLVNLSDYLDTGLFLDHRITRQMVREEASGTRVLNLFAYTGAFTVYAASGGAAATVSVDASNTYLDWAEENLRLNELDGPQHQFIRSDAMAFFESGSDGRTFDLAVVDPPTFSNRKGQDDVWDVQRRHAELLTLLVLRMSPGGVIYFSTNRRRFKLDEERLPPQLTIREISRQSVPEDFRNRRIHRCWRMGVER